MGACGSGQSDPNTAGTASAPTKTLDSAKLAATNVQHGVGQTFATANTSAAQVSGLSGQALQHADQAQTTASNYSTAASNAGTQANTAVNQASQFANAHAPAPVAGLVHGATAGATGATTAVTGGLASATMAANSATNTLGGSVGSAAQMLQARSADVTTHVATANTAVTSASQQAETKTKELSVQGTGGLQQVSGIANQVAAGAPAPVASFVQPLASQVALASSGGNSGLQKFEGLIPVTTLAPSHIGVADNISIGSSSSTLGEPDLGRSLNVHNVPGVDAAHVPANADRSAFTSGLGSLTSGLGSANAGFSSVGHGLASANTGLASTGLASTGLGSAVGTGLGSANTGLGSLNNGFNSGLGSASTGLASANTGFAAANTGLASSVGTVLTSTGLGSTGFGSTVNSGLSSFNNASSSLNDVSNSISVPHNTTISNNVATNAHTVDALPGSRGLKEGNVVSMHVPSSADSVTSAATPMVSTSLDYLNTVGSPTASTPVPINVNPQDPIIKQRMDQAAIRVRTLKSARAPLETVKAAVEEFKAAKAAHALTQAPESFQTSREEPIVEHQNVLRPDEAAFTNNNLMGERQISGAAVPRSPELNAAADQIRAAKQSGEQGGRSI